ncbi:daunorubicin C-13 ketoreductase [Mariannaea sp. PMI_226]|nr:daunorubicin C-13 ketoreductase [Mariannaea sp. PMI_226]
MPTHWDPLVDMPVLSGKIVVVTGGNTGIGLATVKFLALRGAKVYIAARSQVKATKAIQSLLTAHSEIKEAQLIWLPFDLCDLSSVMSAVEKLKSDETKIDILVNNAGMITHSVETLGEGWEMHMAINHIGHFVFTNGVLPLLKAALMQKDADVRVVTLTSNANHIFLPPSFEFDFTSPSFLKKPVRSYPWQWRYLHRFFFHGDMVRYAVSKVANAMFAQELQRLLDEQRLPILSISVHPGGVASEGVLALGTFLFKLVVRLITTDQGAITPLFAATAKEARENPSKYGGKYLEPFGDIGTTHKVVKDQNQVKGMWENTMVEANNVLQRKGLPTLPSW